MDEGNWFLLFLSKATWKCLQLLQDIVKQLQCINMHNCVLNIKILKTAVHLVLSPPHVFEVISLLA